MVAPFLVGVAGGISREHGVHYSLSINFIVCLIRESQRVYGPMAVSVVYSTFISFFTLYLHGTY